jgi:drug/metabolite transporter (DMT)-like permease
MIWLWMAVTAGFFNALWTALSKKVLVHLSPREFTLVFRLLTALFLFPLALYQWTWPLSLKWWGITLLAGFFEGLRTWMLVRGVKTDYYTTYAFYNLTPFFTVIAAPLFLPESQNGSLIMGGVLIALGAFVFHRMGKWSWGGLWGAIFSTAGVITNKIALADAPPLFFAFWSFGIGALVLIPLESLARTSLRPQVMRKEWRKVLAPAFWSFLASVLFYLALAHAPASKINPLVRANLLFGFLFSYFYLREKKNWAHKALGGGFILAGLILVAVA